MSRLHSTLANWTLANSTQAKTKLKETCLTGNKILLPPPPPVFRGGQTQFMQGWGLERWAQNFAFFLPSPPQFSFFLLSLGGPRRGFTQQPKNSKRAHFRAPALQTPPKFHERTPRERRKKENCGGRGKKATFWAVRRRGVRERGGSGRTNKPKALRGMPGCWRGNWQPPEVAQPTKMVHNHEIIRKANIWSTTAKICTTTCPRVWFKSNCPHSNWPKSSEQPKQLILPKSNWPKSRTMHKQSGLFPCLHLPRNL